jgi:hypothetical protein
VSTADTLVGAFNIGGPGVCNTSRLAEAAYNPPQTDHDHAGFW